MTHKCSLNQKINLNLKRTDHSSRQFSTEYRTTRSSTSSFQQTRTDGCSDWEGSLITFGSKNAFCRELSLDFSGIFCRRFLDIFVSSGFLGIIIAKVERKRLVCFDGIGAARRISVKLQNRNTINRFNNILRMGQTQYTSDPQALYLT